MQLHTINLTCGILDGRVFKIITTTQKRICPHTKNNPHSNTFPIGIHEKRYRGNASYIQFVEDKR